MSVPRSGSDYCHLAQKTAPHPLTVPVYSTNRREIRREVRISG